MLKGLSVVSLLLSLLLMMECIEAPPNPFDEPPRITENPKDQSVLIENKATFSVKASGLNLKYQWYKDTTVISGATDSNYTIHQVNSGHDSMTYHCVVKNDNGEATSKSALLTVMYRIEYNANAGNGTVPLDMNAYEKGISVRIKKNDSLSRIGYVFCGWCRTKDYIYPVYKDSDNLIMGDSTVTLYAQWAKTFKICYKMAGQDSGTLPPDTSIVSGSTGTISDNIGLYKEGYKFAGWIGGGTNYFANQEVIMNADLTLQPRWVLTNSIVYCSNGLTDGTVPVDSQTYSLGTTVSTFKTGNLVKDGYVFDGWSTTPTGIKATSVTMSESGLVVLYARWVIKDTSGNYYSEVRIGNHVWMVENLKTRKFRDGTDITLEGSTTTLSAQCKTGDSITGVLYNLYAVENNLAPVGWHIATEKDWKTINSTNYLDRLKLVPENAKVGTLMYWISGTLNNKRGQTIGLSSDSSKIFFTDSVDASSFHMVRCIRNY